MVAYGKCKCGLTSVVFSRKFQCYYARQLSAWQLLSIWPWFFFACLCLGFCLWCCIASSLLRLDCGQDQGDVSRPQKEEECELITEGVTVERVNEYKYLGTVLDNKLIFECNIINIVKKSSENVLRVQIEIFWCES